MRYRRGEAGAGRLADGVRAMRGRRGRAPTGAGRRNENPRGRSCKDAPGASGRISDLERRPGEKNRQKGGEHAEVGAGKQGQEGRGKDGEKGKQQQREELG